jgi:hypothetical protein
MLTKVIDAHPDIAILMENIFQNRRRHWSRASFWNDNKKFQKQLNKVYSKLKEPIVGNKVITPDVWSIDDIIQFCNCFRSSKVLWIVRNPKDVFYSRYAREDYSKEYNDVAKKNLHLDFSHRTMTYASSWRQSIENYYRLKELKKNDVMIVYYEDLVGDFENQITSIFSWLNVRFHKDVLEWYNVMHHDHEGNLVEDLKYKDKPVHSSSFERDYDEVPIIDEAIEKLDYFYKLWGERKL